MKTMIRQAGLCLLITGAFLAHSILAQTTIGSDKNPQRAAILDLKTVEATNPPTVTDDANVTSEHGGLLLPRVRLNDPATLEPFITTTDSEWADSARTRIKERHAGLTVYNLTTGRTLKPGAYVWSGNIWQPAQPEAAAGDNGITRSGDTLRLGGRVKVPASISLSGKRLDFSGSDTLRMSAPLILSGAWSYTAGGGRKGAFLMSDGEGNASWEFPAALPSSPSAVFDANGATFDMRSQAAQGWINTGTYIEIPPGRWMVAVTMHVNLTGSNLGAFYWYWIRSTFIKDGKTTPEMSDFEGSNYLISGRAYADDTIISGYVIINNSSQASVRYYYHAGWVDIDPASQAAQPVVNDFGSSRWRENSIVAFALAE